MQDRMKSLLSRSIRQVHTAWADVWPGRLGVAGFGRDGSLPAGFRVGAPVGDLRDKVLPPEAEAFCVGLLAYFISQAD